MDEQFVADQINVLEMGKQRRKKICYEPLADDSVRDQQRASSGPQETAGAKDEETLGKDEESKEDGRRSKNSSLPNIGKKGTAREAEE